LAAGRAGQGRQGKEQLTLSSSASLGSDVEVELPLVPAAAMASGWRVGRAQARSQSALCSNKASDASSNSPSALLLLLLLLPVE
jgi:hypothetical protein